MFGKSQLDIRQIVPTSKMSLKISCLNACGNNIAEAEKLYNYIAADLKTLPDVDLPQQTILERADSIFAWVNGHQDDIMRGVSLIQSLRTPANGAETALNSFANVPPIPNTI